ncbi:DUF397 domain-containing protein [Streptomyces sp. ME08-AFT2]|uniref:DUF397 domain-containing protein n=1 Tax=Streptomyces sp. ME08-AFT2 TaxID=3028683 RepID=UPI0029AF3AD7|nr:DUF397 domain-containing protein [Streptomyces sp. ME08-AFT2]MDX3311212.1 DUF397 domain-containing protein [Streptomyces sp. ME08-AFT2]
MSLIRAAVPSSGGDGDGDGDCVEVALDWSKSSHSSGSSDNCVEVAACPAQVHVRDSKVEGGPELTLSPAAWARFVAHAAK